uniref:Recombinase n=1 Tax=Escherichia coli TaxID=562 RepID=A0A3G4RTR3_ECOLX|nr:recombinase [Escherichia coli]
MKIFIDDGSTNIKLAWLEDGDVKTLISLTALNRNGLLVYWMMLLRLITRSTARSFHLIH